MTLPQPVQQIYDAIAVEYPFRETEKLPLRDLLFRDVLIIPDEQWDWTGTLNFHETVNLKRVFNAEIASGPRAQIFEKEDSNLPAYATLVVYDEVFFWVEWP